MKKIFLLVTAALSALFSSASEDHPLTVSAGQFRHIELGSDMKVVLVSASELQNEIKTGSAATYEKLNISVSGDHLRLELRQSLRENERVYLVVEDLQSLTVGENTSVETENYLTGKEIKINVEQGARIRIKTYATVKAYGADGWPVPVQTKPASSQKEIKAF